MLDLGGSWKGCSHVILVDLSRARRPFELHDTSPLPNHESLPAPYPTSICQTALSVLQKLTMVISLAICTQHLLVRVRTCRPRVTYYQRLVHLQVPSIRSRAILQYHTDHQLRILLPKQAHLSTITLKTLVNHILSALFLQPHPRFVILASIIHSKTHPSNILAKTQEVMP